MYIIIFKKKIIYLFNSQKWDVFYLFLIILIIIFARLATWFYPVDSDHWIFFWVGSQIAEKKALFSIYWDHKPPLIFFVNASLSFLFGNNLVLHRIFFTLWMILDSFIFFKISSLLAEKIDFINKKKTFFIKLSLVIYLLFRNFSQFTSSGNNTENFSLLFLLLMYWVFLKNKDNLEKNNWQWYIGFFLAIIVHFKTNFLIFVLPIFIHYLYNFISQFILVISKKEYKQIFKNILNLFLLPNLKLFLPTLIFFSFWLWYANINNISYWFWLAFYEFNSKYLASSFESKVSNNYIHLFLLSPFLLLFFISSVNYIKKYKQNFTTTKLFLLSWIFTGFIFIFLSLNFFSYYFLILIPLLTLILTLYILNIKKNSKIKGFLVIILIFSSWIISLNQFKNFFLGENNFIYKEQLIIANYIKNNTNSGDTILFYDYGATFYTLANRKPATRFVSISHVLLDYKENFGYNFTSVFLDDMNKNKPKFILKIKDNRKNLYDQIIPIKNYIDENYQIEKTYTYYNLMKIKTLNNNLSTKFYNF